jgi:hypothetical protein
MSTFDQLLGKLSELVGGERAPSNAMAGARNVAESLEPKVTYRASMLPVGNYDDGSVGMAWPQSAVDAKNAFGRFHRGENPQPQDAVLAGLAMTGAGAFGLGTRAARATGSVAGAERAEASSGLPFHVAETGRIPAPMDFDARVGLLREQLPTIRPGDDFIAQTPFDYMTHGDLPEGFAGWMDSLKPNPPRSPATVDLRDVRTFQRGIDGPRASAIAERGALDEFGNPDASHPAVWQLPDGRYVVQDGNHRLAAAVLRGDAKADVDVLGGLPSHSVEAGRLASNPPEAAPAGAVVGAFDQRLNQMRAAIDGLDPTLQQTWRGDPQPGRFGVPSPFEVARSQPYRRAPDSGQQVMVDLAKLKTNQPDVSGYAVKDIAERGPDPSLTPTRAAQSEPTVARLEDGSYLVLGGNHRLSAAALKGETHAPATLFSNPKDAAPAGLLATGEGEHHSRAQPRSPSGRFVTTDSFDGRLSTFQKLIDTDGDGVPDTPAPTNAMAAMRGRR